MREVWDRRPAAPLKTKQALVFFLFQGSLKEKVKTLTSV